MATRLTERDLAEALPDVLDRVRRGERFVIEQGGEQIAVLSPLAEPTPAVTGQELLDRIGGLRMPGDGFADDIETARAAVLPAPGSRWPD
jgi:antitoxin (DNA-binding transcriptional repressor) of toxin-antitoxin stability system